MLVLKVKIIIALFDVYLIDIKSTETKEHIFSDTEDQFKGNKAIDCPQRRFFDELDCNLFALILTNGRSNLIRLEK